MGVGGRWGGDRQGVDGGGGGRDEECKIEIR